MKKELTSSFVLTLPLKTTISDDKALEKYFELSRRLYNSLLGEALRRFNLMRQSKLYNKARKETNKTLKNKLFREAEKKYEFDNFSLNKYSTTLRVNEYKDIDANTVQALSARAFNTVNKLRFGKAKKVYFVKYGEMTSIEGLTNRQGIRYRDGIIYFNKLKLQTLVKSKDTYAQLALQSKVKFCRILRKQVGNKIRYYVQLIMEGLPPVKQNHKQGIGEVGIDIGTQTIAIVSDKEVKFKELAEGINLLEDIKTKLQRKLDRQRRANNPNKYNPDGTINIKNKDKWIKSKNYIKTQNKLRNIQRKIASQRKQSHEIDANYILSLGNIIKVETMNFSGLQTRTKETTVNSKGRFNKKKRFGKSLANKAPAMLLEIINRKLKYQRLWLFKVNTYKVKASQYNPFTDDYVKKDLNERWNCFNIGDKEIKIQRDLMSALIVKNVILDDKMKMDTIDKEKLLSEFDNFKILHDKEILRLRNLKDNGIKLLGSMGI